MAQQIQAKNISINFTNFGDLANKDGYSIGTANAYSNIKDNNHPNGLIDGSTGKIVTSNVIEFNSSNQNKFNNLTLPALFLNWSGAQLTFNGNTYTINTTPELLEALLAAGKVDNLGSSNSKLRSSSFYAKYHELLNRINNLPIPSKKSDIIISGKSITGLHGDSLDYGSTATITFTTSVPCTIQLVPESNSRYDQRVRITGSYTHKIDITNTNTTDFEYQIGSNWVVIKVAASYVDASQYNVENGYAYLSDGTNRGTQYGIGYDIYMQPEQQYPVYYYDAEVGGIKLNEEPQYVKMNHTITLWPAFYDGVDEEEYTFVGWKNRAKNYIYKAGAQVIVTPSIISGGSISFEAVYEEKISYTYVEPEPEEVNDAYVTFSGYDTISGTFKGGSVSEGKTITLPSAGKSSTSQYSYTFNGWKNELDGTVYQAGSTITIWSDTNFTAQFTATTRQYNVTLNVTNGTITEGSKVKTVKYGQTATWYIAPNDGYQLPTTVDNGLISGNRVTSQTVRTSFTVTAFCPEAPISYTYVEPEEPEYIFSIDDNYDTIAWNGTKTVIASLTKGSASNTQWSLTGDTQYATISSSTGSSTKVTANNIAVDHQGISIDDPTITYNDGSLKCVPGKATITTYGANKSVTLKATNSNATSGSPQSCIINIQAKPQTSVARNWSSIDWYIVNGHDYASLSNNGTTCKVTNNNHSGSVQVIKVRCVVYYGSQGSRSKDYTFNVPNIEEETSYTYVG